MSGEVEAAVVAGATSAERPPDEPKQRTKRKTAAVQGELAAMDHQHPVEPTAMMLMADAVTQGLGIDVIERLAALQRQQELWESEKQFAIDFSRFQSECPPIPRSDPGVVRDGKRKKFASLGTCEEHLKPYLYAAGLSYFWEYAQPSDERLTVTCVLLHRSGHAKRSSLTSGMVVIPKANELQNSGGTQAYLQRYTLLAVTGKSTMEDRDGEEDEPESKEPALTPEQLKAKQLEMARAAAGATEPVAAQQTAQPAVQTPAAPVAAPAAAPAPQQPPVAAGIDSRPRISEEQMRQVMGLCKELFASGQEAFAEIQKLANIKTQAEFAGISEGVALSMLAELNHRKHLKLKTGADAKLQADQSQPGSVTAEQRTELRDLSVQFFDGNADSAAAQTVNWLRRIGLSTPRELSINQAAARIAELKAGIEKDRIKKQRAETESPF